MVKLAGFSLVVTISLVLPASAQWLDYPTPGIPRTPDGKPNLSAPGLHSVQGLVGLA